jgi:DNA-binding CsgD family transcriptional regulator
MLALVQVARGATAIAAGRPDVALGELARVHDPADPAFHQYVRCWTVLDLADAGAHSGRREEARALIGALGAWAHTSGWPVLEASLPVAAALLADDDTAGDAFAAAALVDLRRWPYQRARLALAHGAWLRRRRHVVESRAALRSASDTFTALGASSWADRARRELRASGESADAAPAAADRLTAQERQIATMAAGGMTNREIGTALYLSHRTVGTHLYRIYPKLDVTTRAQLAVALGLAL